MNVLFAHLIKLLFLKFDVHDQFLIEYIKEYDDVFFVCHTSNVIYIIKIVDNFPNFIVFVTKQILIE